MGRRSQTSRLNVWMNGFRVGVWIVKSGKHEFEYDKEWLKASEGRPLSLSIPLRSESYTDDRIQAYFDNLLPDNEQIRRRIQERFGTSTASSFALLSEIGRDCVGAIQLLPEGSEPTDIHQIKGASLNENEIEQLLGNVTSTGRFRHSDDDFRISLAGAQEKTALLKHQGLWLKPHGATPTTHIFKLPLGQVGNGQIDMSTSVENEWLCARILEGFGIPVANTEILQFGKIKVLAVERFDRKMASDDSWIIRLPQEDFCQATGTPSGEKYENHGGPGISAIMSTLLGSDAPQADMQDFYRTQIAFWLLCAIDGHAKNFSLFIGPSGRFRLTPRYDVLSAYPVLGHGSGKLSPDKVKMAMAVWGKEKHYHWKQMLLRHFINVGVQCGVGDAAYCEALILAMTKDAPRVIQTIAATLPEDFPTPVSDPILKGVLEKARELRG